MTGAVCAAATCLSICMCVFLCVARFRGDAGLVLLQKGGPLVIRRLCAAMGPEVVFREFASILDDEQDLAFASTMVQVMGAEGAGGGGAVLHVVRSWHQSALDCL